MIKKYRILDFFFKHNKIGDIFMKKFILIMVLLINLFITNSSHYKPTGKKMEYENQSFYEEISKYKSFNQNKYNLYLTEFEKVNNVIYALNKVNYPNFLLGNIINESFTFGGGIFINKSFYLKENYVPKNLIPVTVNKIIRKGETMQADKVALNALNSLFKAAKKEGIDLVVYSAYRSYYKQYELYQKAINKNYVAKAGHSEHQTGLAFDISTLDAGLTNHFSQTIEYLYLSSHAYLYGFIERYPRDKESITNYPAESWHYRYVGCEIAKIIYEQKITLEEYVYMYVEL